MILQKKPLKAKLKLCSCGCGKEGILWKDGMLKSCFLKASGSKSITKVSERQRVKIEIKKKVSEEVHLAMREWWKKQPNKCMACGCNLPKEFHSWMVDHLLEKSKYPQFAQDERNFFLVCFIDHEKKTKGFPIPKHEEAIEKAKQVLL